MKVDTPLGTHPFELVGLERRGRAVALVGRLAGPRSDVLLRPAESASLPRRWRTSSPAALTPPAPGRG